MSVSSEHDAPATAVLREIVTHACRAPSMFNAQPWLWRIDGGRLELYADRTRSIRVADPRGRNLVIGCGAALDHARVAAAALGWSATLARLPDPESGDLLAVLDFHPGQVTSAETELLEALHRRRTDRRRFSSWQIPPERLEELADLARSAGTRAVAVTESADRQRIEVLTTRALNLQADDDRIAEEQRSWIDRGEKDGVPTWTVPRLLGTTASTRSRFGAGFLAQPGRELESADGVIVLCGPRDDVECWLRAGEGLSRLWLHAVTNGVSVVPLTQVVEVEETRQALRDEVLDELAVPYLLLRVGWHSATDLPIAATPRRPLEDVLLV